MFIRSKPKRGVTALYIIILRKGVYVGGIFRSFKFHSCMWLNIHFGTNIGKNEWVLPFQRECRDQKIVLRDISLSLCLNVTCTVRVIAELWIIAHVRVVWELLAREELWKRQKWDSLNQILKLRECPLLANQIPDRGIVAFILFIALASGGAALSFWLEKALAGLPSPLLEIN